MEEGGYAGSVGAKNGYAGDRAMWKEVALVRFKSARTRRSGQMMEESMKQGYE